MFEHLLVDSVVWKKHTGKLNEFGKPLYGADTSIKVRLEKTSMVVKEGFSNKLVRKAELFSTIKMEIQDRLVFDGMNWEVLASDYAQTASGAIIYFIEAYSHGKS